MKRSPIKRLGKRGLAWEKCRRELKVKFQRAGITSCEARGFGCWRDSGLGFAHKKKRRNLGPGELSEVALLCNICHDRIELLPEQEMTAIVTQIIDSRPNKV